MVDQPNPPRPERTGGRPAEPDATAAMPAVPDATAPMPAVGAEPGAPLPPAEPPAPRWAARAQVRPGSPADELEYAPLVEEDPYRDRSWLRPVVVGLVALLLLALVGVGVWLILRGADDGAGPAPAQSPSSAAPVTTAPSSPARTSAPPSSAPPSPSPTPVDQVTLPNLVGAEEDDARTVLDALGIVARISYRTQPGAAPGTVLRQAPGAGASVPRGSAVDLVVARAASPAPTSSPTGGQG